VILLAEILYYLKPFSSKTDKKNSSILSRYTAIVPLLWGKVVNGTYFVLKVKKALN
jgi:hypothetical protein